MAEAIDLAAKTPWTLVLFTHGGGTKAVTNRDSDFTIGGVTYASVPDIVIQLPENDGMFRESNCTIQLPLEPDPDFTSRFTNGEPHAATTVDIIEVIKGDAETSTASINLFTVFRGLCVAGRRNVRGRKDIVQVQALPLKSRMKSISLGLPCNHQCIHRLGDAGCKVNMTVSNRTQVVTVTAIDGAEVTVDAIPSGLGDRFFQRGFMIRQDLPIGVHDWRDEVAGNKLKFFMNRKPPANWLGQTVTLFSGCDKTQETCDGRYANLANFMGLGFSIPPYHPSFEDGGSLQ